MLSRLGGAVSAVGSAAMYTAGAVGGAAMGGASYLMGADTAASKWYETADGAVIVVDLLSCEQKGEDAAIPEGVPPKGDGDDSDDEFADAQDSEDAAAAQEASEIAAAAAAVGTVGKFWVFRFAVVANGARIFEFDETTASAAEKHAKILAAGVAQSELPALEKLDDAGAAGAAGAALATYYAALFATPAAKASEPVRELFEPRSDAAVIEIDAADDVGVVQFAKDMAGKLSQGANLNALQMPPRFLSPESALEKNRGIVEHVKFLLDAPSAVGPEAEKERMLAVVRWCLSTLTEETFGLKPYNPILGEVYRGTVQVGDAGPTVMLAEQVSHHPPISASYVRNEAKDVTVTGHMEAAPRFWGNSVEVEFAGPRVIRFGKVGETYTMNTPNLCFRGIFGVGRQFVEWCGAVTIRCEETGMTAKLNFEQMGMFGLRGEPNSVSGEVLRDLKDPSAAEAGVLPESELLEATADNEDLQPETVMEALQTKAKDASAEEAAAMSQWLAARLTAGMSDGEGSSIAVALKSLNTISSLATASSVFAAAALATCTAAVGSAEQFAKPDPVHGDLPANTIRTEAAKLATILKATTVPQEIVCTLRGRWDRVVALMDHGMDHGSADATLMDRSTMPTAELALPNESKQMAKESTAVWGELTTALKAEDWATARIAKTSIEQAQRDIRKAKEDAGETHVSTCFAVGEAGEWVATQEAVAQCIADCA